MLFTKITDTTTTFLCLCLLRMTPFAGAKSDLCWVRNHDQSVDCEKGMVHKGMVHRIPLACSACQIRQTSRCLNNRLLEHKRNVKTTQSNLRLLGIWTPAHIVQPNGSLQGSWKTKKGMTASVYTKRPSVPPVHHRVQVTLANYCYRSLTLNLPRLTPSLGFP